jgi:hypothetical protein
MEGIISLWANLYSILNSYQMKFIDFRSLERSSFWAERYDIPSWLDT